MTARWVVDEVQPARDLSITWQPISLLFKNDPDPDSDYYRNSNFTRKLMRVMESVRAAEGDEALGALYLGVRAAPAPRQGLGLHRGRRPGRHRL